MISPLYYPHSPFGLFISISIYNKKNPIFFSGGGKYKYFSFAFSEAGYRGGEAEEINNNNNNKNNHRNNNTHTLI